MAVTSTALLTAGLAVSAIGAGVQTYAGFKQADAMKQAEELRKKQMDLESKRKRREIVRNMIVGNSIALTNATASGSQEGSGLQGGYGQIAGNAGRQTVAVNQNQEIGAGIFDANGSASQAGAWGSAGGGLASIGGVMLNNIGTFNRIGWAT